jgi:NAD(P)-dependent dehydrogenase (short-subunit alcohol dehydrogenase family)
VELGLRGKRVIVTGASEGIGLACVKVFLDEGAAVTGAARNVGPLDELAAEHPVRAVQADLGTADGARRLVEEAVEAFGGVDIVVNNVGIAPARAEGFIGVTDEQWLDTFRVNVLSMVRVTRAALPYLLSNESSAVVSVASESGRAPEPNLVDYGATKATMLSIAKSLAIEFGPRGLRSNVVSPGPTRTPLWDRPGGFAEALAEQFGRPVEEAIDHFARNVRQLPLGRLAAPEEIARMVAVVASDVVSSFVTGADIAVNGGSLKTIY